MQLYIDSKFVTRLGTQQNVYQEINIERLDTYVYV